jgi:aminoglycoside N3'-acetyltransferase
MNRRDAEGFCVDLVSCLVDGLNLNKTLFVSAFSFNFPHTKVFSAKDTAVSSGFFGDALRDRFHKNRLISGFYSFFVFGEDETKFLSRNFERSTGTSSIMSELVAQDLDLFTVGHHFNKSFSAIHHVEHLRGVDYRYEKWFCGQVESLGKTADIKFSFFVRDVSRCKFSSLTKNGLMALHNQGFIEKFLLNLSLGRILCHRLQHTKAINFLASLSRDKFSRYVSYVQVGESESHTVVDASLADKIFLHEISQVIGETH